MTMTRVRWAGVVWACTAAWLGFLLLSLHFGWLDALWFDLAHHRDNPAIDFFQIGRAYRNFFAGRSLYDTFANQTYGPYATWYVYHPLLALLLGPWLAPFLPWTAYHVWTVFSIGFMAASAGMILRRTEDPLRQAFVGLLLLGSFPFFVMLRAGNVQSLLVFALTLVFVAVDEMRNGTRIRRNRLTLAGGLLLSLFSKPAVLIFLPLLVLLPETRKTTLKVIGVYVVVSLAFLVVPGFNPEPMSWHERWMLATHPQVVQQTMNVYTNGFTVTQPMKDNSIHWLETMAMADTRMNNVDVYSLPVFLDGLLGAPTSPVWYRIPGILVLGLSLLVLLVKKREEMLGVALDVLMAASLVFFLSFGIVWEYSYTSVLPLAALLLTRRRIRKSDWTIVGLAVLIWLPSLYWLTNATMNIETQMVWMRVTRVLPVLAIFCILVVRVTQQVLAGFGESGSSKQEAGNR